MVLLPPSAGDLGDSVGLPQPWQHGGEASAFVAVGILEAALAGREDLAHRRPRHTDDGRRVLPIVEFEQPVEGFVGVDPLEQIADAGDGVVGEAEVAADVAEVLVQSPQAREPAEAPR